MDQWVEGVGKDINPSKLEAKGARNLTFAYEG